VMTSRLAVRAVGLLSSIGVWAAVANAETLGVAWTLPAPQVAITAGGVTTPYPAPFATFRAAYDLSEIRRDVAGQENVATPVTVSIPGLPDATIASADNPTLIAGNANEFGMLTFFWHDPPVGGFDGVQTLDEQIHDISLRQPRGPVQVQTITFSNAARTVSFVLPDGRSVSLSEGGVVSATLTISVLAETPVPTLAASSLAALVLLVLLVVLFGPRRIGRP